MLIKKIIIIAIIFSVSYADEANNNIPDGDFEYIINTGSLSSDKISATLRNEIDKLKDVNKKILENLELINRKMDGSEIKVAYKLDEIKNKFDIFENNFEYNQLYHEMYQEKNGEIIINNKLDELQKNIDEKLASLDQHINQKLHTLEKIIADKTDIIKNNKLSVSVKNQQDLDENNIISKLIQKSTANEALGKNYYDTTQKLSVIETKISELENTTPYLKFDEIDKNTMKLEDNFNSIWTELNNMLPEMPETIYHRLDTLNDEIPEQLEESKVFKLDEVENIIAKMKAESLVKDNIVSETTPAYGDCKQLQAHGYDFKPIRMDNETFNHVTLESDEDGLIHFEMHLAIKSAGLTVIQLSSEANPTEEDGYFAIGIADGHARSWLYNFKLSSDFNEVVSLYRQIQLQSASTPADIITTTEFKAFYVRIINETLEFGSEGTDSPPILSYRDERFRTLKYIGFTSWGDHYTGSFLIDCPPKFEEFRLDALNQEIPEQLEELKLFKLDDVEEITMKMNAESLVKEEIVSERTPGFGDCMELQAHGYDFKPIRMDNETFNHVTLESDEDGLVHFEMHLAIKSAGLTVIQLSSEANPTEEDGYFAIGIADGHARSWLYNFKLSSDYNEVVRLYSQIQLQSASTPADIITTTEFKAFYVRIINETLEFGSEGIDSTPILSYRDERFRTLKYIGFTSWGDYYTGSFLIDCPPKFEESL